MKNSDKYSAMEEIASGGMGRIFRVRDNHLGRVVAVKKMHQHLEADPRSRSRFVREAQTLGQLDHPNIVTVHELGLDAAGQPFFSMQMVDGETLSAVIERLREGDADTHRIYSFAHRLAIVQQVCNAIEYAHEHGILHRDLKPENIMLGRFGQVLVMDWGLCKEVGTASADGTREGTAMGSLHYAAPEQIVGDTVDARADIYSIGAVMYELLGLRRPHDCDSLTDLVTAVLQIDPIPLDTHRVPLQGRVPRELSLLVMQALRKKPQDRYASVADLRRAIQQYLDGNSEVVCVQTGMKRMVVAMGAAVDNHGTLAALLLATALATPLGACILWWQGWL